MKLTSITGVLQTLILTLLVVLVAGCGSDNPTVPGAGTGVGSNPVLAQSGPDRGNRVLWGMWDWYIDLDSQTIDIVPTREGLAHVNVVGLLEPVPLKNLRIDETTLVVDLQTMTIDVDVILRHPIVSSPQYTGFDVRGIFITPGTLDGLSIDDSLVMSAHNESKLLNADGYTRWWNPTEFTGSGLLGYVDGKIGKPHSVGHYTSTINGYKYFADGLSAYGDILDPLVIANRGRFSSGAENRRHYTLQFGPGQPSFMVFNYAVDASWESPDNIPPTSIDDFPLSANALEPFHIRINQEANSLYYDPDLDDCPKSGGVLRIYIDVATWQGSEGIDRVEVGSPELNMEFGEAVKIAEYDVYNAHVATYLSELVAGSFSIYDPQIIIAAYAKEGNYKTGPEGLGIPFDGPWDAELALYSIYRPEVGTNSPPQVGPVIGPTDVLAGEYHTYFVSSWFDCQDMNEDLVFAWEKGDDFPPLYNDGIGHADGLHPGGDGTIEILFPDAGIYHVDCRVLDYDGKYGYSEQPLDVTSAIPPIPVFPPGGVNLKLELKRSVLNSYEYSNNPSDIPEIKLTWDGSSVSYVTGEWVIYRDKNPYDEIENWDEIGTVLPFKNSYSNKLSGQNSYNSGASYYYKVSARSIAGNPDSESPGSTEWAFIEFENAESSGSSQDQHPWTMGYGGYEPAYFRQWEIAPGQGAIAGSCWMMDPDSEYMRRHIWSVIASDELPILTDPILAGTTEEWYIEMVFGGQVTPMNECWDNYARLSVGTVPDLPSDHNTAEYYLEYDESHPSDFMAGEPYYTAGYWSSVNSRFDETPATYNDRYGWGLKEYFWPGTFTRFRLTDLDPNGTARVRAAIGFGSGATTDTRARPRADEIAVIIW